MNPYGLAIKWGTAIALVLSVIAGIGYYGHKQYLRGKSEVEALWKSDRAQWESALAKQKGEAAAELQVATAKALAAERANADLKAQQEKDYAQHQAVTAALRRDLSTERLRFVAVAPSPGRGDGGGGTVPEAGNPASAAATAYVELPDSIAASLRQLAYEADQLADNYRLCYAYATGAP